MIRNKTAQIVANSWHGGQWSALYQLASSGQYIVKNHLRYLQEIEDCLHPEYALHPHTLSKAAEKELNGIKNWIVEQGDKMGIETKFHNHPIYGYPIPFVGETTSIEIVNKIDSLKYAI